MILATGAFGYIGQSPGARRWTVNVLMPVPLLRPVVRLMQLVPNPPVRVGDADPQDALTLIEIELH